MPIRFTTSITINDKAVWLDVPPNSEAWQKANSIFHPLGPAPTRAWFLMTKRDLDDLVRQVTPPSNTTDPEPAPISVSIDWTVVEMDYSDPDDPTTTTTTNTFTGLYLVDAERLKPGGVGDVNSLYLVEFADARLLAARKSDCGVVISNITHIAAYANGEDYLTETTTIGTWDKLVQALWDGCRLLGTYPNLPGSLPIDGVPNNTWLIGLNSWRALTAVLDQLDCAVARDPFTNEFTIVQLGDNQDVFPPGYTDTRRFDGEPVTPLAAVAAAILNIYFVFSRKSYGQERDTERTVNWAYNGQGSIKQNVKTGIVGGQGTVALWDDLAWVLDENNQQSDTNKNAIATRADNRKARYVTRYSVTPQHRIHRGIRTEYLPGSQVRATVWRNWGDHETNKLGGTVTEFVCCVGLISGMTATSGGGVAWLDAGLTAPEREQYGPPDLGRRSFPTYPRLPNLVQITTSIGSNTTGNKVKPEGTNDQGLKFHRGAVMRFDTGSLQAPDHFSQECWILFTDKLPGQTAVGDVEAEYGQIYGPARLSGMTKCKTDSDPDGLSLPVYVLRKGASEKDTGTLIFFELTPDVAAVEPILDLGSTSLAYLLSFNTTTKAFGTDGTQIIVSDPYASPGEWQGMEGLRGIATKRGDNIGGKDVYSVVWMERPALITYGTISENFEPTFASSLIDSNITFFQQGNKRPPNTNILSDPNLFYPMALGQRLDLTNIDPARFMGIWNDRTKLIEAMVVQQQTFYCLAVLKNNVRSNNSNAVVTDVQPCMFSPFNLYPRDLEVIDGVIGLQINNRLNRIGIQGTQCLIFWNRNYEEWVLAATDDRYFSGLVQVDDPDFPAAGLVDASSKVQGNFILNRALNVLEPCYIIFQDYDLSSAPDNFTLVAENQKIYHGKLIDFDDDGSPVYQSVVGEQKWEATCASTLAKGVSGSFTLLNGDGTPSTISVNANPKWNKYTTPKKAIVERLAGTLVANQLEC